MPEAARAPTMAFPMSPEPPVTNATFPLRSTATPKARTSVNAAYLFRRGPPFRRSGSRVLAWRFLTRVQIRPVLKCRNGRRTCRRQEALMTAQADFASQDYYRNPAAAIEKLRNLGPVVEVRFPIIGTVW